MVNAISMANPFRSDLLQEQRLGNLRPPSAEERKVRETFQQAVAGTFYKQMLKALRSTQGKPAYFHGGQAEEIFRNQMDETISEDMARSHGGQLVGPLFAAYERNRG